MIKIDLKEFRKNDVNILKVVLDKVKNDNFIIDENNSKIKVASFGYDEITGEDMQIVYESSDDLKIADMIVDDVLSFLNRNTDRITNITLNDWFYYWLNNFIDNYSKLSRETLIRRFSLTIIPSVGNIRLQEYQNSDFNKLLKYSSKSSNGLKRSSICLFRSLINKAIMLELLPGDKEVVYTLTYKRKMQFDYFDNDELDLIIPDILESKYSILYLLSMATGITIDRIIALRKKDINSKNQEIISTKGTRVVLTSLGVHRRVITELSERKYYPHIDIINAILELMKNYEYDDGYFFFDYYDLINDLVILKDLKKILHKHKMVGAGKTRLAQTAERIAIEKGMHHVDFKHVFGYKDYKSFLFKFDAMNKKGRRQKEAERKYAKLIDNIKKGVQK